MNVYTVIATDNADAAGRAVVEKFPHDNLPLTDNAWLVAGSGTAREIAALLGMPAGGAADYSAIVTLVSGYYGYAANNIWEWIAAKQASSNG